MLRWMFDDYTYLRQYSESFMNSAAVSAGMTARSRFDEGCFLYDRGPLSLHWSLRPFARRYYKASAYFNQADEQNSVQRRIALTYVNE